MDKDSRLFGQPIYFFFCQALFRCVCPARGTESMHKQNLFKWRHFPADVILLSVHFMLYKLLMAIFAFISAIPVLSLLRPTTKLQASSGRPNDYVQHWHHKQTQQSGDNHSTKDSRTQRLSAGCASSRGSY